MDKVSKLLKKLTGPEKKVLQKLLKQVGRTGLEGLDVKRLVGREDIFRIRKSDLRVILRLEKGKFFILTVERRSEKTYKNI